MQIQESVIHHLVPLQSYALMNYITEPTNVKLGVNIECCDWNLKHGT